MFETTNQSAIEASPTNSYLLQQVNDGDIAIIVLTCLVEVELKSHHCHDSQFHSI